MSIKVKKCPVCGSKLNTGSTRYATVTPDKEEPPPYSEYFWVQIFYCTKDDRHNFFHILKRDNEREKEEANNEQKE